MDETIFALSSGSGRSAVAVVRVSGPAAGEALRILGGEELPKPRRATLTHFRTPDNDTLIDIGLALWFPTPESATGEDVAELHVHGGRAVVAALIEALAGIPGFRPAEPGEFTRRAFEAGRLDLTQAEGIADLVAAETEAQRRQAVRQMEGGLRRLYDGWRDRLLKTMATVEATLDFSDQELPDDLLGSVGPELKGLQDAIQAHLGDERRGERLRDGFYIAILGAPNVGKSSLLNRLAGRDAAIVSERAGTTRDVIEVRMDLGGWPVTLADTAGLREADDALEAEGVRRALARANDADLKVVVLDGERWPEVDRATLDVAGEDGLVVINKIDLLGEVPTWGTADEPSCAVSCATGAGIDGLLRTIEAQIDRRFAGSGEPSLTRARHRHALEECRDAVARARECPPDERLAEEVRLAARYLGGITGRVDVEEMLGFVFKDFCIGK